MPNNITDVSTFTAPIQTVADGDSANAANFALSPQGLSNRTRFLFDICKTNGVTLLRQSATTATMGALTGVSNNEICFVPYVGIYQYNSSSVLTADGFLVVTASGMGVGRWIHELQAGANQNGGFAAIGVAGASTNRIPVGVVPNGIAFTGVGKASNTTLPASGSFSDITSMSVTWANAIANDIIFIDTIWFSPTGFGTNLSMRTVIVDGGGTVAPTELSATMPGSLPAPTLFFGSSSSYTVANSGSITVKGQGQQTAGGTVIQGPQSMVRVMFVRP